MPRDIQLRLSPEQASSSESILRTASQKTKTKLKDVQSFRVLKRSIDARKKNIIINLSVRLYLEAEQTEPEIEKFAFPDVSKAKQVIVVGAGPAGYFAALTLIENGYKPIVLERGKSVSERKKDIASINRTMVIPQDSNYGFGEGGAGTFSDGKLYTRSVKRGDVRRVLELLVHHGAHTDILIDAHPHIGTDKLPAIIKNIRLTIEEAGGFVHFDTKVTDFILENSEVKGVVTNNNDEFTGPVILATGHSARDIYRKLHERSIELESKTFAMGVRVEHPQQIIDQIQYHNPKGRGQFLPAASYNLKTQVDERGVYSFCMCPGGHIVPAATQPGELVVNGMSPSGRNSKWANSGIVVEVRPEDIPGYSPNHPLIGIDFQHKVEQDAFKHANKTQKAPSLRLTDFINGKVSNHLPETSYIPGLTSSALFDWMPQHVTSRLQKGFHNFGLKAKGFVTDNAIIVGVESRTSSPIRIPRDREHLHHITIKNLFPCGEGAGYAGGIMSSALDGVRCAMAVKL